MNHNHCPKEAAVKALIGSSERLQRITQAMSPAMRRSII